jgi:hypothetical protein
MNNETCVSDEDENDDAVAEALCGLVRKQRAGLQLMSPKTSLLSQKMIA